MKVYKYGTGEEVPKDAKYLCTIKNGYMGDKDRIKREDEKEYVWHYFLVP